MNVGSKANLVLAAVVALVTSAATALLLHRRDAPLPVPEAKGAPGEGLEDRLHNLEKETAALRAEVEACRREIASIGREAAVRSDPGSPPGAPAPSSEEKAREAVQRLVAVTDPARQEAMKKMSMDLLEFGDAAVPPLREFLESGADRSFGRGFSVSGGLLRGYPNLRSVIVETLAQIGTEDAKEALLRAVENAKTYPEVLTALFLYHQSGDRDVVRVLAPACLRTLRRMVQGDFGDVGGSCRIFVHYLALAIPAWGLASDQAFMDDLISIGKLPSVDDSLFADLLGMAIAHSTREAWEMLAGRGEGPSKAAPAEIVARMSLTSIGTVDLKNYAEFLRLVFSGLNPSSDERMRIYRAGLFRIGGRPKKEGEDPAGWAALLAFAKERRGAESEAELLKVLEVAIAEIESKLK